MFDRISNGWALAKQSLRVLSLDKELLVLPLLSGLSCILILVSFALPLWNSELGRAFFDNPKAPENALAYVVLFLFYFANYFVIVFFNCALVACALIRFAGGDPTLGDGLRAATARLPQILAWALVSATVGLILRLIESRSEKIGRFVAGLLGMAWSITTFFVVPVLVVERVGPVDAIKRSLAILRKNWGETLAANFGLSLIVFLACLVAALPLVLGIVIAGPVGLLVGGAISVALWIVISLVSAAANSILVGALYQYAAHQTVPEQFDEGLLRSAFVAK